jgi:vacuolar-type H+-ATPase subunit H
MVGEFADKVAGKVEGFKDTLDGLADKKIKIPGFGGGAKGEEGTEGAVAPGGGLTKEQVAAAKKNAKEKAKLLADANKDVKKSYEEMNKIIIEARKKSFEIEADFNKEVVKINQEYSDKALKIDQDYADKAIKLEEDAMKKRASVIQKSKDLLINAFSNATKLDLADLMKDSDQTGASMVVRLKEKFRLITDLQAKAGALASKGFSQTFIQDIISQGPQAGSAMADSILNSTPETIDEIKALYGKVQDVSENGMVKLADQMYEGMGLATSDLAKEYVQIGVDLKEALDKNSIELNDALASNQKELQDALLAAQTAYNEAIDKLEKDTKDKLASLQTELAKTAETIRQLSGAKAAVSALSSSPAAPIIAGTYGLGLAAKSSGSLVITNNTTVNGTNLADPAAAADELERRTRFGATQSLTTAQFFEASYGQRMGTVTK